MRHPRAAIVVASAVLGCAVAATDTGCFGATEVSVTITTTARCELGVQTQLYAGALGSAASTVAPAAETRECGAAEPRVGTLTIVPSGARDDRFELEVVAGVGVPVSSCVAKTFDPADPVRGCIFARRRVSFLPHKSLSLPLLLSERCINVPCGADQTCDLGTCTPTIDCSETGCPRERGEVALVDAGPDVLPDSHPPPTSCGPTADTLVGGAAIVGQLVMDGTDFVYANVPSAASGEIRRVSRRGGPASVVRAVPGLAAVALGKTGLAFASNDGSRSVVTRATAAGETSFALVGYATSALAFSGDTIVGSAETIGGSHAFAIATQPRIDTSSAVGPVFDIQVDDDGEWYGVTGGITLLHYRLTAEAPKLVDFLSSQAAQPDIAVAARTVYLALNGAGLAGIHRVPRASVTHPYDAPPWIAGALPQSIANDGVSLYYLEGTTLSKVDLTASGTPTPTHFGNVGTGADRLAVDADCVYWVEGNGRRIMRRMK
jgi:hypothetical protein